jgi:hypothetical protein
VSEFGLWKRFHHKILRILEAVKGESRAKTGAEKRKHELARPVLRWHLGGIPDDQFRAK